MNLSCHDGDHFPDYFHIGTVDQALLSRASSPPPLPFSSPICRQYHLLPPPSSIATTTCLHITISTATAYRPPPALPSPVVICHDCHHHFPPPTATVIRNFQCNKILTKQHKTNHFPLKKIFSTKTKP